MEDTFNVKRVRTIINRYFKENMYREILYWSIISLFFAVFDQRDFVLLVLFVSGVFFSIHLLNEFWLGKNNAFFIMAPATAAEKIGAAVVLSSIYHFGMIILSYTIGNLLVIFIYHLILKIYIPINWDLFYSTSTYLENGMLQTELNNKFWIIWLIFALMQSIVMAGSLYFRRLSLLKSVLLLVVFIVFLLGIQILFFKTYWDVRFLRNALFTLIVMYNDGTIPSFIFQGLRAFSLVLLPFMWLVSLYSVKEKEIR